jgi:uncharacterized protein
MTKDILIFWRARFLDWLQVNWIHEDSAHDIQHLHRVWRNCQRINEGENKKADELILLTASYFHDLITLPKNDPERDKASLLSAENTAQLLRHTFTNFPKEKIQGVFHAVHAHSFSADIETKTIEAKILQDADRIDALGAMGIARLFYTAGKINAFLFHTEDPSGERRELDDKHFALDHIEVKLLKLSTTMKTISGKQLAAKEEDYIRLFREKFLQEIS